MTDPEQQIDPLREKRTSATVLTAAANAASFMLIELAVFVNAETTELIQTGVTMGGEAVGDWKITVQKLGVEENEAEQLEMFDVPAAAPTVPRHGDS